MTHTPAQKARKQYDDERAAQKSADARLIAAAPELLAALQWALTKLDGIGIFPWVDKPDFEKARAAIALATGEERIK